MLGSVFRGWGRRVRPAESVPKKQRSQLQEHYYDVHLDHPTIGMTSKPCAEILKSVLHMDTSVFNILNPVGMSCVSPASLLRLHE